MDKLTQTTYEMIKNNTLMYSVLKEEFSTFRFDDERINIVKNAFVVGYLFYLADNLQNATVETVNWLAIVNMIAYDDPMEPNTLESVLLQDLFNWLSDDNDLYNQLQESMTHMKQADHAEYLKAYVEGMLLYDECMCLESSSKLVLGLSQDLILACFSFIDWHSLASRIME